MKSIQLFQYYDKIRDGIEEYKNYLEVLKIEEFNENLNDTEDQSIKKAESILDRLDEMIRRNGLANKKTNENVVLLNKISNYFDDIVRNIEKDVEKLALKNNEIIDITIDSEKRKVDKLILQYPKKQCALKGELEDRKEEWNEYRINTEENRRKKQQEVMKRLNTIIDVNEIWQIEKWTQMKLGNVIFDSEVDVWNENKSVFDKRILNKSNLIFIIENVIINKFGGYVNVKIDGNDYINDPRSFVLSLKPNGRLKNLILKNLDMLFVDNQSSVSLFAFGSDICIFKENCKNESYCEQDSFDYNVIQNALCGKLFPEKIKPTRITVIQLI